MSDITYRYSNCGSAGYDGPDINRDCVPFYKKTESPILLNQCLFSFNDDYEGAQGFQLPRNGLYNITIAGARGGNYHYGLGHVQQLQVELTTDYEYLIMVGHRGTSVCEVEENAANPVCQEPRPTTVEEAQTCDDTWYNFTNTFRDDLAYEFNGGGGGGGASMIWPRRVANKQFTSLPIVIAPGGGGASGVLDYDMMAELLSEFGLSGPNDTNSLKLYNVHVNSHFTRYTLYWPEGVRGYRPDRFVISGSGGGWESTIFLPFLVDVDGKLLSQQTGFAEGGSDCSASLQLFDDHVFTNVFGGYGGGGGGCGSGGGGGGYTGGHVLGNVHYVSGGGGDVLLTEFPDTMMNNFLTMKVEVEVVEMMLGY